ncbi:biotin--[acetyl-CoA-carboxylase] ligase [Desulfofustis limnaeus]|jgi:BirA family biotin operon repressor/biotin-[acetyl-CoA-carboxylase] ligase|uniref:BPL/LPL catalytic domain-containing protein n=1 Tax=Desulfofustis limnaeus TaxID=2740163 RepID=A0ABN6LYU4_9BACT|nr:biotin--[acetyl-CoA-carboxylase] ligase [Desulfofustis limnaeus]MDX9893799.1 biotin--[acetyl-CoA-carboxylase] ligase [Desulfofustis sp.]BDD85748.1 hypothetical protein DPPLL_01130 [Desulfofustis limnaeus]
MFQDEYLRIIDSTNDRARELAEKGGPHGSGVVAEQQTAGRGRLKRPWFSPAGKNLYCSYIIRPVVPFSEYPRLTLVAGLAVAHFMNDLLPGRVGLKWPNDILLGEKKCGGILCESVLSQDRHTGGYAIVGIGLNLLLERNELPEELRDRATSLLIEGGPRLMPLDAFNVLRRHLLACIDDWQKIGFQWILERWSSFDIMVGRQATWVTQKREVVTGVSLGPDSSGQLCIEDAQGTRHLVVSGDVTLAREL